MSKEVALPSGARALVRGLKLKEFQMFSDKRLVRSGDIVSKIVETCFESWADPGPYPDKMPWGKLLVGDQVAMILGIRVATHGPSFDFKITCPSCRTSFEWGLSLDELAEQNTKPYSDEALTAYSTNTPCKFHIADKIVELMPLTMEMSKVIMRAQQSAQATADKTGGPIDDLEAIAARIHSVEGMDRKQLAGWVGDFEGADMTAYREANEQMEGGIDTAIDVRCPEIDCRFRFEVDLPLDPQRFWMNAKKR
jgi:hypothetical protein